RCLVDDTVVPLPFHPLCHAPLLGEDMMDIDRVIEVSALLDLLTGTQIGHIMLEEKGVEALVSSTVASTQGVQPPRGELCLLHRSWLGAAPLRPGNDLGKVSGEPCFGTAPVHFAKDSAPEPP